MWDIRYFIPAIVRVYLPNIPLRAHYYAVEAPIPRPGECGLGFCRN